MKKLMFVLIAAILVMSLGCSKSSDSPTGPSTTSPIAGTWKQSTVNGVAVPSGYLTLVINSNATWSVNASSPVYTGTGGGTYTTSGSNLTLVMTTASNSSVTLPQTKTFTYTVTATSLTITDTTSGAVDVYTKQ